MRFDPPLRRNGVEVLAIYPAMCAMSFVIYVTANSPLQAQTLEMQALIDSKVNDTIHYLETEGYIPTDVKWMVNTGLVVITP